MEKIDLSKELIENSEYYDPRGSYVATLKKNNVKTINQLMDDEFVKTLKKKWRPTTIMPLRGLISMLKYKYKDEPLYYDVYLDKKLDIDKSTRDRIYLKTDEKEDRIIHVQRMLGCSQEIGEMVTKEFCDFINNKRTYAVNFSKEKVRLIDFISWITEINKPEYKKIYPYAKTYIESYEKNKNIDNNITLSELTNLQRQLKELINTKNNLNEEIKQVEEQIAKIEVRINASKNKEIGNKRR